MLVRFTPQVSLADVGRLTERCEELGVQYKFIQELSTSYLVVESSERAKLSELYHQFRHLKVVDEITWAGESEGAFDGVETAKFKLGSRWIGHGSRPLVIAGSPYLESQKHAVTLAGKLAGIGVNIYKAGPYRPTGTLGPKALYDRTGSIVREVARRGGIPSTGTIEALGPKTALTALDACALHVPGRFMFETNLRDQLARLGLPVLLERHPDASTRLWLDAAGTIVAGGNPSVALLETGRRVDERREIDLVNCARLIEACPLPLLVYPSRAAESAEEVRRIARASLALGASGVLIDVHPSPSEGLLTEGFCLSLEEFEGVFESLKPLLV